MHHRIRKSSASADQPTGDSRLLMIAGMALVAVLTWRAGMAVDPPLDVTRAPQDASTAMLAPGPVAISP